MIDANLFQIQVVLEDMANITTFLTSRVTPTHLNTNNLRQKLVLKSTPYRFIGGTLYKLGRDEILCRCILEHEWEQILLECYEGVAGGHYAGEATVCKIILAGYWWPTMH